VDGAEAATVGFTEFAARALGPLRAIDLPPAGTRLRQGERAWSVRVDGGTVDMLSPVNGTVTEINEKVLRSPHVAHDEPYEAGWLLKVRSRRLVTSLKQLLSGQAADRWLEDVVEGLHAGPRPALGRVYQDGGALIDGFARAIDPDRWETVARRLFLTEDAGGRAEREGADA
jgi:glycine cleavage system H protein